MKNWDRRFLWCGGLEPVADARIGQVKFVHSAPGDALTCTDTQSREK